MPPVEQIVFALAILLFVSVLGSKVSDKIGVPALLLFLGIGMLAGSEGLGGIHFDNPYQAQGIGVVALVLILFAGGLSTRWREIRPIVLEGVGLATLGVLVTATLVAVCAKTLFGFSWLEGFLLGSIISSTDAAAVFTILRSRSVSLKGNLKPLLELESGSNDPMAVFLTLGFLSLISQPEPSISILLPMFFKQMAFGGILGLSAGWVIKEMLNRIRLEYEGLYPVLSISMVLMLYAVTTVIGGSGFLAVYIAALRLGNSEFLHRNSLIRFHDGIAWLMQITMFLVLGLQVFPSRLVSVTQSGFILALFLMLIARPLSVFFVLLPFGSRISEKILISWVGLRGAAPIILATFPMVAGVAKADEIFNLVFFIVITSVLFQGTSIPLVARRLGVALPISEQKPSPIELVSGVPVRALLEEITIPVHSSADGKPIVTLGFPKGVLIALVYRKGEYFVPRGDTVLMSGDTLFILADPNEAGEIRKVLGV